MPSCFVLQPAAIRNARPWLRVGGHRNLTAGGQQTPPTHGILATQGAGGGRHDSPAGTALDRHFRGMSRTLHRVYVNKLRFSSAQATRRLDSSRVPSPTQVA